MDTAFGVMGSGVEGLRVPAPTNKRVGRIGNHDGRTDMAKNGTMSAPGHYADELLRQRRALADFGTLALQEVDFDKLLTESGMSSAST